MGRNSFSVRSLTPRYSHIKILLANCRQLDDSRMFCNSNQLGEARSGRRGRSFLCQPRTSSKNIHGGSSKECLKSQLLATNVACSAHFTGSHCLGNGPFHTGSLGIHGSKLGGLFACAGLMKGPIGLFVGLQDQRACGTACTLSMERTR